MTTGLNEQDRALLRAINKSLVEADSASTQHLAMTSLLWTQHLLATLLRQMQDD